MRYYGCKTKLLDFLSEGVAKTGINSGAIFCDLFSGTTTVARHFKQKGYTVYANDFLEFSYSLARSYIKNNDYPLFEGLHGVVTGVNGSIDNISKVIEYLNNLGPIKGFIYKNYCPSGTKNLDSPRMYFTDDNGIKIDAIRTKIQEWKDGKFISDDEFYIFKEDANALIKQIHSDILYLDPPYNARQYAPNYFLLELIAEGWFNGKKPRIYGKTGMRVYEMGLDLCE